MKYEKTAQTLYGEKHEWGWNTITVVNIYYSRSIIGEWSTVGLGEYFSTYKHIYT